MKDKIIFWLDSDITSFGIAKFLQEKYESEFFAILDINPNTKGMALVITKNHFDSYAFSMPDNVYQKFMSATIWYYHDHVFPKTIVDLEYLSNFEKRYGVNLWLLALNERLFYQFNYFYKFTRNEILSILEQECKLFEAILD